MPILEAISTVLEGAIRLIERLINGIRSLLGGLADELTDLLGLSVETVEQVSANELHVRNSVEQQFALMHDPVARDSGFAGAVVHQDSAESLRLQRAQLEALQKMAGTNPGVLSSMVIEVGR